ncbi:MAG: hypothetical protein JXR84_09245 [Anaerolineae bacterium]|nr:hypothetical protein [Anaerolineae bacterium]
MKPLYLFNRFEQKVPWSANVQRGVILLLCVLGVFSIAAKPAYGPGEGTIRGAAFVDINRNGKMDANEQGLGGVYFTVSNGEYSHTYYSENRTVDEFGNTYATGTFGPAPLPNGGWRVKFYVPQGYVATTPVEHVVHVPESGQVTYVYMGLYPAGGVPGAGGILPLGGLETTQPLVGALVLFMIGGMFSIGLGVARRRS